jgi:carbon monoxide dehydrogenase subunit G
VSASYSFAGTWTVPATPAQVHEVLVDLERYPRWWPQVLAVASLGPDDARVLCRSALPYTLDLLLHARSRDVTRLEVGIDGDLRGRARWDLAATSEGTRLDFAQEVSVSGWLGRISPLLGPVLRWNHDRMMAGCIEGLSERVVSRRA